MAKNTYKDKPDISGNFGDYGGRYVAETLMPLIIELENAYNSAKTILFLLRKERVSLEIMWVERALYILLKD